MSSQEPKPKKRSRGILKIVLACLAGLVLFSVAGLLFILRTGPGHSLLERAVEGATAGSEDFKVRIEGLGGEPPFHITAETVSVSDESGTWLELRGLSMRPRFTEILAGVWRFEEISARSMRLERIPKGEEQERQRGVEVPEPPRVVVDQLDLPRVRIGEAVFGRSAELSAESGLSVSPEGYALEAEASRLDRPEDRLRLQAEAPADLSRLSLNATLREARGGLAGAMLGLPEESALEAELSGSGPLDAWRAELKAEAEDYAGLAAEMILGLHEQPDVEASGTIEVQSGVLPDGWHDLVGGKSGFELKASRGDERVTISRAVLEGRGARLRLEEAFLLDGGAELAGRMRLKVTDHVAAASLAGLEGLELRAMNLLFEGSLAELGYELDAELSRLAAGNFAAGGIRLEASGTAKDLREETPGLSAKGEVLAADPRISGVSLPAGDYRAVFQAETSDWKRARISSLRIFAPGAEAEVSGAAGLDGRSLDLDVRLVMEEPGDYGLAFEGVAADSLEIAGALAGSPAEKRLEFKGDAGVLGLSGVPEAVTDLGGRDWTVSGEVSWDRGIISSQGLEARADKAQIRADGRLDPEEETFQASWTLTIQDPEALYEHLGIRLGKGASLSGSASGGFSDFELRIEAFSDNLILGSHEIERFSLRASAEGLPQNPRADLGAGALWKGRELRFGARAGLAGDALRFREIEFSGLGLSAVGEAGLSLRSGLIEGELRAKGNTAELAEAFDLDISGLLQADITLSHPAEAQKAEAEVRLSDGTVYGIGLETLLIAAGPEDLRTLSPDIRVKAEGRAVEPFDFEARGRLKRGDGGVVLALRELRGRYAGLPVRLADQARIALLDGVVSLEGLNLGVESGRLELAGRYGPELVELTAGAEALPLGGVAGLFGLPAAGVLDGKFEAEDRGQGARASLDALIRGFRSPGFSNATSSIEIAAKLGDGRAEAELTSRGGAMDDFSARANAPLRVSLLRGGPEQPETGPVRGEASGVVDLDMLRRALALDAHYFSGRAPVQASLSGSVREPEVQGSLELSGARYENLSMGLVLDELGGRVVLRGKEVVFEDITAGDGAGGRFRFSGLARLGGEDKAVYECTIRAEQARVARTDVIRAAATGRLKISGDTERAEIGGKLVLDPVEIRIPETSPESVQTVQVEHVNATKERSAPADAGGNGKDGFRVDLDVEIEVPARLDLRGRGLTAEFRGDLDVGGSAAEPHVLGALSVVRGRFEFLGKTLTLERGSIAFPGGDPLPFLDLLAETDAGDITARVRLSGTPDNLDITLESDPPLPDNEILAHILFERGSDELNPVQALRLAQAARRLSGGSGPGLLAEARQGLGLDDIRVSGTEDGLKPEVGVGKYVSERVYVELERNLETGGKGAGVTVEITPEIDVQGGATSEEGGRVGLFWKHDY